ncbi:phosphopyruvate hydratase [Candidatus Woesearchaeota archaeon CG10_big_fil_rev_8_21_14_0_10_44_13]|nr:MAG: phosphopyruvate hydratase [Candidatus Woesearchaeota archaeon CG10_big_fil_rev_8_21_14_0_10_44_13]
MALPSKITKIKAREILDSRGNPTIEVDVYTKTCMAREEVPSGASTGAHEAVELRDGEKRYNGMGVRKAVANVNDILGKKLRGMDVREQQEIDEYMLRLDSTHNKSKLGANAILGVSLACASCSALVQKRPLYEILGGKNILPVPFMNVINGGKHADNKLSFQEFMIAPMEKTFAESLRLGAETYHELKKVISKKYGKDSTNVGDEGGFAPNLSSVREALDLLVKTIDGLGYGNEVKIAIDAASSEFYKDHKYNVDGRSIESHKMIRFYEELLYDYPIISLEDPFEQDDFAPYSELMERLVKKVQIVGDDLLVTNPARIRMAVQRRLCNALLLKVNQIGTLTEAMEAAKLAMDNGWNVMVSHRSGETSDAFIADLAVGLGAGQIKSGAPCRSERLAKYNQLLRIEEELGNKAKYRPM